MQVLQFIRKLPQRERERETETSQHGVIMIDCFSNNCRPIRSKKWPIITGIKATAAVGAIALRP